MTSRRISLEVISIAQPRIYPNITYLDKINSCDTFVISNDLEVNKSAFEIRNKYYNYQAKAPKYLNMPIQGVKAFKELKISDMNFAKKHRDVLSVNYKHSPFFDEGILEHLLFDPKTEWFLDYFCKHIMRMMYLFNITTNLELASDANPQSAKSFRLDEIITHFKGDVYLSGIGGKNYLWTDYIKDSSGADVIWHDTDNDKFNNIHDDAPMLMIFDTLFEQGIDEIKSILND